jgi:hypothetical protein
VPNAEATNTNFIVLGLIRLGLEPTIYRTRDEHANHYATDAVHTTIAQGFTQNVSRYQRGIIRRRTSKKAKIKRKKVKNNDLQNSTLKITD